MTQMDSRERPTLVWTSMSLMSMVRTTPLAGLPLRCLVRDDTLTVLVLPTESVQLDSRRTLPISHAVECPRTPARWRQTHAVLKWETDARRQPLLTEARSLVERTLRRRGDRALRGLVRNGLLPLTRQAEGEVFINKKLLGNPPSRNP